ncbi:MAG: type II toxin-antitoxin system PemK/MazF family toxin [Anaerolineae bacterium]
MSHVCQCTSWLARRQESLPTNRSRHQDEANLSKQSVVNLSQVLTVEKEMLVEWIGRLSDRRVQQILAGLRLVTEPRPW